MPTILRLLLFIFNAHAIAMHVALPQSEHSVTIALQLYASRLPAAVIKKFISKTAFLQPRDALAQTLLAHVDECTVKSGTACVCSSQCPNLAYIVNDNMRARQHLGIMLSAGVPTHAIISWYTNYQLDACITTQLYILYTPCTGCLNAFLSHSVTT